MSPLYIIASIGGLGIIAFLAVKLFSADGKKMLEKFRGRKVKGVLDKLKATEKKQNSIMVKVGTDEKVSKESRDEIINIQEKAKAEIEAALKRDNIKDTTAEIETLWGQI